MEMCFFKHWLVLSNQCRVARPSVVIGNLKSIAWFVARKRKKEDWIVKEGN